MRCGSGGRPSVPAAPLRAVPSAGRRRSRPAAANSATVFRFASGVSSPTPRIANPAPASTSPYPPTPSDAVSSRQPAFSGFRSPPPSGSRTDRATVSAKAPASATDSTFRPAARSPVRSAASPAGCSPVRAPVSIPACDPVRSAACTSVRSAAVGISVPLVSSISRSRSRSRASASNSTS